jgi:hypothetical protein
MPAGCGQFWEMQVGWTALHLLRGLEPDFTLDERGAFVTLDGRFAVSCERIDLQGLLGARTQEIQETIAKLPERWERFLLADEEAEELQESTVAHIYPSEWQGTWKPRRYRGDFARARTIRAPRIQYPGYGLRGIPLLGTWVNKGKKKSRGPDPQLFFSARCGTISPFLYPGSASDAVRRALASTVPACGARSRRNAG